MCFKKNKPNAEPTEEINDKEPVSLDELGCVSGAGNPWQDYDGVPQKDIDEDLRDRV